jgi:hypothetical protein
LGQGRLDDPELVVAEPQELVELLLVGFVEQGALEVLEEVELAPFVDLEVLGDPGECAEALEKGEPRVGKVQYWNSGSVSSSPVMNL